ncbi:unnamed protein product [Urochloa humidicola]
MCVVTRTAHPSSSGCPRRLAPPCSDTAAASRALETKKPLACGVMTARDSLASQANDVGFSTTKRKIVNSIQVEVEVIATVGLEKSMDLSACLATIDVVPMQKRTKCARSCADTGVEILTVGGDPPLDCLQKQMASELEALHKFVKKAELVSGKSKRALTTEPRMEAADKAPSAKKRGLCQSRIRS